MGHGDYQIAPIQLQKGIMSTKEQLAMLQKLGEKLLTVPPTQFNMDDWSCGTQHCAIGWCPTLVPEAGITLVPNVLNALGAPTPAIGSGTETCVGWHAVTTAFGISYPEAQYLFSPEEYDENDSENITIEQVSERILEFVKDNMEGF